MGRGLTKLSDYDNLKARLDACEETASDYSWSADSAAGEETSIVLNETPPPLSPHWRAGHALPYSLADWSDVQRNLDEKLWVEVEVEQVEDIRMDTKPRLVRA